MKTILAIIFCLTLIAVSIWSVIYKYQDCKRVGHSGLYCALGM